MSSARSFEDILALAKPRETEVVLCLAGDLAAEAERIAAQIDVMDRPGARSSLADGGQKVKLVGDLDDIRELMKDSEVTFRFRSLPARVYSDLIAAHPGPNGKALDVEALQPDLIAKCIFEPAMTREQVDQLLDRLNEWQRTQLFDAAWNANNGAVVVPSSRAASASPSLSDAR